jgi:hypothetical protein
VAAQMPNEDGLLEAVVSDMAIVAQAREHYKSVDGYQQRLLAKLADLHHYYAPQSGDQWPEDVTMRPGKIHYTANYCKPAVDIRARLLSLLPRISQEPNGVDEAALKDAENAEKIMLRFLELSGWEMWLAEFTRICGIYGFGVLKPFWNTKENRPDVIVLENPGHLRVGWGSSDFRTKDWAIYEYSISPMEVMRRFPDLIVKPNRGGRPTILKQGGTHSDPLNQRPVVAGRPYLLSRPLPYEPSEYEGKQITCWDYWFKDANGDIWNAIIVGGDQIAGEPKAHPEFNDLPYIWNENDHEPGVPWGIASHEHVIDLQREFNRLVSHALQITADEIDPAWQINADSGLDGVVPRSGEIVAVGEDKEVKPIPKSFNFPPVLNMIAELKDQYHDITGSPRILFGTSPGSQTTGRALAVQVEAAANRLDFSRRYLYQSLRELLIAWAFMLEKRKLKAGGVNLGKSVSGFRRWKIIAPEITPKDVIEASNNAIQKVQAKIISLKTAREELGYDSPIDEETLVVEERANVDLFPGDVQVKMAVLQALQALQMQEQAQQAATAGLGNVVNSEQAQGPGLAEDDNEAPPGPATVEGSLPPAGGPAPGGQVATALIRPTTGGQAQALNQLATQSRL